MLHHTVLFPGTLIPIEVHMPATTPLTPPLPWPIAAVVSRTGGAEAEGIDMVLEEPVPECAEAVQTVKRT